MSRIPIKMCICCVITETGSENFCLEVIIIYVIFTIIDSHGFAQNEHER
jgi:hypothetical protein